MLCTGRGGTSVKSVCTGRGGGDKCIECVLCSVQGEGGQVYRVCVQGERGGGDKCIECVLCSVQGRGEGESKCKECVYRGRGGEQV